jgi:hypothetical protein
MRSGLPSAEPWPASATPGHAREPALAEMHPEGAAREALRTAVERLDQAEREGCPSALTLAQVRVAGCYRSIGALVAAEQTLRQALRAARRARSTSLLVDVLCELGETACAIAEQPRSGERDAESRAARDRARDEAFEASSLVHMAIGADWTVDALLRISDVLNRCGDHEDAAVLQGRAAELIGRA